ncbi:MAG: hypothetical protein R2788_03390 [Saprospiraceae bacterium]
MQEKFSSIPYLNSSIFRNRGEVEADITLFISNLKDRFRILTHERHCAEGCQGHAALRK